MAGKQYKPDLTAFFLSGKGGGVTFHSVMIKDELFDALQSIERGGKLTIKVFDNPKSESKGLSGYIGYQSPAEAKADYEAFQARRKKTAADSADVI